MEQVQLFDSSLEKYKCTEIEWNSDPKKAHKIYHFQSTPSHPSADQSYSHCPVSTLPAKRSS